MKRLAVMLLAGMTSTAVPAEPTTILFVGNSFTFGELSPAKRFQTNTVTDLNGPDRSGRTLGGSLSWEQPQQLTSFSRESPFNGMTVPGDVTVTRQVLAEPDATLSDNTWATLADGTPLVTAARRGKGLIVLFHVTGDTRWSDLPLSGAFVEMLKRIVALAGTTSVTDAAKAETKSVREVVPPSRVLDGFGNFIAPPPTARPVPSDYSGSATADHPLSPKLFLEDMLLDYAACCAER